MIFRLSSEIEISYAENPDKHPNFFMDHGNTWECLLCGATLGNYHGARYQHMKRCHDIKEAFS
jgi:hypothetical protein